VKNIENPKKCVFNTFASVLAFLASSQKNLNFQRYLKRVILKKSPIFLSRDNIDKKNPKK